MTGAGRSANARKRGAVGMAAEVDQDVDFIRNDLPRGLPVGPAADFGPVVDALPDPSLRGVGLRVSGVIGEDFELGTIVKPEHFHGQEADGMAAEIRGDVADPQRPRPDDRGAPQVSAGSSARPYRRRRVTDDAARRFARREPTGTSGRRHELPARADRSLSSDGIGSDFPEGTTAGHLHCLRRRMIQCWTASC